MQIKELPNLSPEQVVAVQDALLANADTLLNSALAVLEFGHVPLARALAILGLEESGKAIAIHERRVRMTAAPEGDLFRCEALDRLWVSHEGKLEKVHEFLVEELYWFGVEPANPIENAEYLGTIRSWTRRNDSMKQRGFYVGLSKSGDVLAPTDVSDSATLRAVIAHVHQIGLQLRLGEHIEGKRQDEQESGQPPVPDDELDLLNSTQEPTEDPEVARILREVRESMRRGTPGRPLNNGAYRFNPPGEDRSPFRNVGKLGYEAETREVIGMADELHSTDQSQTDDG